MWKGKQKVKQVCPECEEEMRLVGDHGYFCLSCDYVLVKDSELSGIDKLHDCVAKIVRLEFEKSSISVYGGILRRSLMMIGRMMILEIQYNLD